MSPLQETVHNFIDKTYPISQVVQGAASNGNGGQVKVQGSSIL